MYIPSADAALMILFSILQGSPAVPLPGYPIKPELSVIDMVGSALTF